MCIYVFLCVHICVRTDICVHNIYVEVREQLHMPILKVSFCPLKKDISLARNSVRLAGLWAYRLHLSLPPIFPFLGFQQCILGPAFKLGLKSSRLEGKHCMARSLSPLLGHNLKHRNLPCNPGLSNELEVFVPDVAVLRLPQKWGWWPQNTGQASAQWRSRNKEEGCMWCLLKLVAFSFVVYESICQVSG